ncbi:hypothetical protein AAFF_G00220640 [Aldrovandia affinis]|uniref:Uncharacterized protein n=1 Tax=Aldrovandia affinis TaxID=143900 RepID=A0AAD7RFQ5_9TELE|nr:hypothetical protein AAFF_G00220640 [Aldrovandia affinis]
MEVSCKLAAKGTGGTCSKAGSSLPRSRHPTSNGKCHRLQGNRKRLIHSDSEARRSAVTPVHASVRNTSREGTRSLEERREHAPCDSISKSASPVPGPGE